MTRQEYITTIRQTADEIIALAEKKNNDYCVDSSDPFFNISGVERLGVCSTETGLVVRLFDKFSRLTSFVKKGEFQVKEESVEDTIRDIVGYSLLALAYLKSKQPAQVETPPLEGTI